MFTLGAFLISGTAFIAAAQEDKPVKSDNTKVNKKDRNKSEPTADQQKMNSSDTDLTKQIRKAIMDDKSLSTYAHNVKVITQNGAVTLKGPVRTEEEKSAIEAKAREVAGADKVTSEITVAPK
jgi:osmotically-inducible protein OsmY